MINSEMSDREKKVFQTGLFDNLTVQDAFTIIALYAAQPDAGEDKEDLVELILAALRKDQLFDEDQSHTIARLNKFENSMGEVNPLNAVESASKVLSPELRQKSFALAARISKKTQEMRITKILTRLSSKLLIDKKIADKTIDSMVG